MDNNLISESVAFHQWLKANDNKFRNYTPDEIAFLAMACGFDLPIICPGINDRMGHIRRLMSFWESPHAEKWMRLCTYENGND